MQTKLFNKISDFYKEKYKTKVYKIPVEIASSCPNRQNGGKGCIFCGEVGAGFELRGGLTLEQQILTNIEYIGKKYSAKKFIIYFQNYSATFIEVERLAELIKRACRTSKDIVGICLSTRPDLVPESTLLRLKSLETELGVDFYIELGLQSTNDQTLAILNRGHSVADFIEAVWRIERFGFNLTVHIIANLPWDDFDEFCRMVSILNSLPIHQIKAHSLYILDNTVLGDMYKAGEIQIIGYQEYIERIVYLIRHSREDIVFQRFFGRAPEERTLFCNFGMSWRKLQNILEDTLKTKSYYQGELYDFNQGMDKDIAAL